MPKVSIVIPVFNKEDYIDRCLVSIRKQSISDIEIVVVNDATPDNSMNIVKKHAKDDYRIRIYNLEKNMGPMLAREKGYKTAKGDFVTFCDGDDKLPPTAIEKLYYAAVRSDADIVSGSIMYFTITGKEVLWKNELNYGTTKVDVLKSLLRQELGHNLCGKLFKASILQNYEYNTYEYATNGEDACLFYQMIAHMDKITLIDDAVYHYYQNEESSSQRRLSVRALDNICLADSIIVASTSIYPELKKDLYASISTSLINRFYQGYDKDGTLSKLISKYNLEDFCSNQTIVRSHVLTDAIKLLIKKYVSCIR